MKINKEICDNCGEGKDWGLPINMSCGYGSIFDELNLDFCSDECCRNFIDRKLQETKEKGSYVLEVRENNSQINDKEKK